MKNKKILNADGLIRNYNWCKSKCAKIMVMAKADAYGHGYKAIVNALKNACKYFGVANEIEALKLKRILTPNHIVLIVGKSNNYEKLIKKGIHITVDNLLEIKRIDAVCKKINTCANIHVAINTGMNRIGVKTLGNFKQILSYLYESRYINIKGIFTHLYNADCKQNDVKIQLDKFSEFIKLVNRKKILIHVGGSYALLHKLPCYVNMVRCGLFVYGYGHKCLKPVMSIESKIIKVTNCKKMDKVGYGNFILNNDTKVALVPMGYADGVPRCVSKNGYVIVNGKKCKILGNICMDMFMIDVTNVDASVGNKVVVLNNAIAFGKYAKMSPYEVLTNFSKARAKCLINAKQKMKSIN